MMILVGASGNYDYTYEMLDHAPWKGFTPTDFIFPAFLFIVGVAQSLSLKKLKGRQRNKKLLKRFVILFALGLLINCFPFFYYDALHKMHPMALEDIRIMGVLQRIALAYVISGVLEHYFSIKGLVIICMLIASAYYLLLSHTGYALEHNMVRRLDLGVLGAQHMYKDKGVSFDPEGLLSTSTVIINVLAGFVTGKWLGLAERQIQVDALLKVMITGVVITAAGYLLSYSDPVIKKLWTTSFTLITAGLSIVLFTTLIYVVDLGKRGGAGWLRPFRAFGKNAILIYLISELLMRILVLPAFEDRSSIYMRAYNTIYRHFGLYNGALLQACTYLLMCWGIVCFFDHRRLYLKV